MQKHNQGAKRLNPPFPSRSAPNQIFIVLVVAHLFGLAAGQRSSEETSKRWQGVGEPQTSDLQNR